MSCLTFCFARIFRNADVHNEPDMKKMGQVITAIHSCGNMISRYLIVSQWRDNKRRRENNIPAQGLMLAWVFFHPSSSCCLFNKVITLAHCGRPPCKTVKRTHKMSKWRTWRRESLASDFQFAIPAMRTFWSWTSSGHPKMIHGGWKWTTIEPLYYKGALARKSPGFFFFLAGTNWMMFIHREAKNRE